MHKTCVIVKLSLPKNPVWKKSIKLSIELSIGESIGGSTGESNTIFAPNIRRSIGVSISKKVLAEVLAPHIGRSSDSDIEDDTRRRAWNFFLVTTGEVPKRYKWSARRSVTLSVNKETFLLSSKSVNKKSWEIEAWVLCIQAIPVADVHKFTRRSTVERSISFSLPRRVDATCAGKVTTAAQLRRRCQS